MSLVRTCLIPATRSFTRSLTRQSCPVTPIAVRRLATATATAGQTQPTTSNMNMNGGTRSDDTSVARRDRDRDRDRSNLSTMRRRGTDLISELERDVQNMMSSFLAPLTGWSPMRLASPLLDPATTFALASRRDRLERGLLDFETLLNKPVTIHMEEKDNEYLMTIQAQGLKKEELDINVDGDMLVISGQHTERRQRRGGVEEAYVSFQRIVALPEDVDVDNIRAEYDDKGNLCRVHLPKKPQEQQQKRGRINIEGAGTGTGTGSTLGTGTTRDATTRATGTGTTGTATGTTTTGTGTSTGTGQKYTM